MVILLEDSPISSFLVTSLGSSSPIALFGWAASSRKSLDGYKLLSFKNDGGHCVLRDLQC